MRSTQKLIVRQREDCILYTNIGQPALVGSFRCLGTGPVLVSHRWSCHDHCHGSQPLSQLRFSQLHCRRISGGKLAQPPGQSRMAQLALPPTIGSPGAANNTRKPWAGKLPSPLACTAVARLTRLGHDGTITTGAIEITYLGTLCAKYF